MVFIINMMVIQIRLLLKLKIDYFLNFWSFIDVGIISCSWTNVGIYIWRYHESGRIGDLFKSTNGYVYLNLQLAVYINDLFTYLLGFCCFFGTIKFIRLCRFNHRLIFFLKTLQHAGKALISFAMMFSIIFMAFLVLFHLLFVSKLWDCASLLHTAQMLFEMTVLKFDVHDLSDAATFLGPFCFSLFIFVVVFICMSMFLKIIYDSFRVVRNNAKMNSKKDQHIFSFMIYRLQRWIGMDSLILI
jgi:hypothetical protein